MRKERKHTGEIIKKYSRIQNMYMLNDISKMKTFYNAKEIEKPQK